MKTDLQRLVLAQVLEQLDPLRRLFLISDL
jgi:hypothetical protein